MSVLSRYSLAAAAGVVLAGLGYAAIGRWWQSINHFFLLLPGVDKVVHFVAGAAIWSLVFWGHGRLSKRVTRQTRTIVAFAVTVPIIAADEFAQSFTTTRTVDVLDPLTGLAGALLAAVLLGSSLWKLRVAVAVPAVALLAFTVSSTYAKMHYFSEGILLEREARYEEAYERYRLALTATPEMAAIYNNIAWLCLEYLQRDYAQALAWAERGVELDPDDPNVRDTLGWAYYKNGRLDDAWREVSRAARQAPDSSAIREHLEIIESELARRSESNSSTR